MDFMDDALDLSELTAVMATMPIGELSAERWNGSTEYLAFGRFSWAKAATVEQALRDADEHACGDWRERGRPGFREWDVYQAPEGTDVIIEHGRAQMFVPEGAPRVRQILRLDGRLVPIALTVKAAA